MAGWQRNRQGDSVPDSCGTASSSSSFEVIAVLSRAAARHDLSLTQLRMLGVLRDREPRMAELADFLGLDRSTVSGLVDRAVATRPGAADRRTGGRPASFRSASPPRPGNWASGRRRGVRRDRTADRRPDLGRTARLIALLDRILGGSG